MVATFVSVYETLREVRRSPVMIHIRCLHAQYVRTDYWNIKTLAVTLACLASASAGWHPHTARLGRVDSGSRAGLQPDELCAVSVAGLPHQRELFQMARGKEGMDQYCHKIQRLCTPGTHILVIRTLRQLLYCTLKGADFTVH